LLETWERFADRPALGTVERADRTAG
jgi:hypothetical protein